MLRIGWHVSLQISDVTRSRCATYATTTGPDELTVSAAVTCRRAASAPVLAKRWAEKSISEMTYFPSSGMYNLDTINL